MKNFNYDTEDLVVALATPWAESALAIIRTSGPGSIEATAKIFSDRDILVKSEHNKMNYGFIIDPTSSSKIDEVMVAVFRAPNGFTGQDSTEVYCHGSLPGIKKILDAFKQVGFRDASPGEFTFRAFASGKMDLTRAEAVQDIVSAKSTEAQSMALNRLSGGIETKINEIKGLILRTVSAIEIQLDYPEDEGGLAHVPINDVLLAEDMIKKLLATYSAGRVYKEGVKVVLAGKTNAGKSSLFNLFLREDRSIVSEVHGTTRDYLESWISLGGIPIKIFDTAGIREAVDSVEIEGIKRTQNIIENADIIIYLVDGSKGLSEDEVESFNMLKSRSNFIPLWSKIDLEGIVPPKDFFGISTVNHEGFSQLEDIIKDKVFKGNYIQGNDAVLDSERQKILLEKCLEELQLFRNGMESGIALDLVAQDIKEALDCLGEITGEITTTDILENMFSQFCVGK
ncbi:tRNA uridine-5-carboxymethylaminomethyl(34) synthesis GTPase MnmE [Thiospirochaeta perfilievii]|uniref:tRNA modification GTPase MnmE n=1 Tax=Thiospirochaeta perfilievii TaxID=252967 RepID=A0A5C1Q8X2_9SPIO|nr:tRNA uridine-5-carboxymethylaminomethyl(34) synthesis GTPase MnmE [Thiospirochaeta perfilievii]QEN04515.1 tRNA uridine-5-carboxymethylaminomethyl(34) synthesis GTPase MnmE [Thiospirochaeta perfilievii]